MKKALLSVFLVTALCGGIYLYSPPATAQETPQLPKLDELVYTEVSVAGEDQCGTCHAGIPKLNLDHPVITYTYPPENDPGCMETLFVYIVMQKADGDHVMYTIDTWPWKSPEMTNNLRQPAGE